MYLSKLEIVGFKSFPNRTIFTFSPGITAIVGPNGCGKTNVVDAIRWALGEQKTTVLRSEVMENVIFNGTESRKALSMAEVSLTLENTKGILPVEYSEVVVTRRLFRDGDSAYLLNNTQCRLKDIIDLFLDTGMGSNSYSVIELKMVEAILSGKPEERRKLIEEAAGINKYKTRRKEAARKLAYVQTDLVRVHDIVLEVEKRVRALQRQSARTKRYNKLNLELLSLQKELIGHNYKNYNSELLDFSNKLNEEEQLRIKANQELEDNENLLRKLEEDSHKLNIDFNDAQETESRFKDEISSLNENYAVSNERINSNEKKIERLVSEINELDEEKEISIKLVESKKISLEKRKHEIASKKDELSQKSTIRDESYNDVAGYRTKLADKNEEIINLNNKIDAIHNVHQKDEGRKQFLNKKIEESVNDINSLKEEIKLVNIDTISGEEKIKLLKDELKTKEKLLAEYKEKRKELNAEIDGKKQELADKRISIAKKNSEFEFLKNLVVEDNTSNKLMNSKKWSAVNKNFLIEIINFEDDYKAAVEAALGEYANVIIVDKHQDIIEAINILESNNLGKAGFISRDRIPDIEIVLPPINESGILGYISEHPGQEEDLKRILRILLGKTVFAKDFQSAVRFVSNNKGYRAVTLKGEIVDSSGFIRAGSLSKKEGISVGKFKRLEKVESLLKKLHSELKKEESQLEILQNNFSEYNVEKLQNEIKKLETDIFYAEKNLTQLSYRIENIKDNILNIEKNISNFENELTELGSEKSLSENLLSEHEEQLKLKKKEQIEINKELRTAENDYYEKEEIVKNLEISITRLETEFENDEREITRILSEIDANSNKKIERSKEIEDTEKEIRSLKFDTEEQDEELKKLMVKADEARSKREFLQEKKKELEELIMQNQDEIRIKREKLDSIKEEIHKIELLSNDLKSKIERIVEENDALVKEGLDLDNVEINDNFDSDAAKIAIQELRNKLSALGIINFMALDEYEEEKEKEDFYHKQVKDLTESEKTLQETIKEINNTAEELFVKTYEDIRTNFKRLFKTLFSDEGDADLKLTNENVLECDIEIIAKPPGKKPHSIDMLSGGEKTLTSIAFLFAIYLVKPSPFCILDEVDAPLDDANIEKFIKMLHDFSGNTQFLVVTHNKKTMETADTMYGITQQEEGVSKIVSVRFEKAKL